MLKAAVIGSGNVAHHFVPVLADHPTIFLSSIFSRNEEAGLALSKRCKTAYAKSLRSIPKDTDIIMLMTNDDSISEVTAKLSTILNSETIILHFSGTKGLDVVDSHFSRAANSWPIYSISKSDSDLDMKKMPICISATSEETAKIIVDIFSQFSDHVTRIKEEDKQYLHVGAVISNNFTNHLMHLCKQLLEKEGQDFDLLKPIIQQTVSKVMKLDPSETQTGPASRNDQKTIEKHLDLLATHPELLKVYKEITASIINANK